MIIHTINKWYLLKILINYDIISCYNENEAKLIRDFIVKI